MNNATVSAKGIEGSNRAERITGDYAIDYALWQLSLILREISLGQQEGDGHIANPTDTDSKQTNRSGPRG